MTTHSSSNNGDFIRLNQFLARTGLCSRRGADEWIEAGRVAIDGIICKQHGTKVSSQTQRITVDGVPLEQQPFLYIALYKPMGTVTTRNDPHGRKTVMDLLPQDLIDAGIFPIGRLDYNTEGLLLFTNDGDWSNILLHPHHKVWKEYFITTDQPLSKEKRHQLEKGAILLDGKPALPARITHCQRVNEKHFGFQIALREGRKRQVRRMCAAVGLPVINLKRLAIGPITLSRLSPGEWTYINKKEVESIYNLEKETT